MDNSCRDGLLRCNGIPNCEFGEDEVNCGQCPPNKFLCVNYGTCILSNLVCDGNNNCPDGSDEIGCNGNIIYLVHS